MVLPALLKLDTVHCLEMVRATKGKRNTMNQKKARAHQKPIEGDPPEWVININKCVKGGPQYDSGNWTIYRVPWSLREVHKSAFVPKIISIGPLHYGDPGLRFMEEHKMRYLLRLLGSRATGKGGQAEELMPQVHNSTLLEDIEEAMRELEQKTRQQYSEAFSIRSNDFVQMMVIDGCFVLELLRLYHKFEKEKYVDDPIFTTRWMLRTIQRDLVKLENQLPFFVLEKLFELISMAEDPPLIDLVLTFFDPLLPRKYIMGLIDPEEEFDHMLEVFRSTFLSSVKQNITPASKQTEISPNFPLVQERQLVHSVTELEEAGVELKNREDCDLLDISFQGGVLKIPPLYIDDITAPLFLNFVAYEQCEDGKPFFTNFLMFFESLINSSADVEILHKNGIINHVLGSDQDVADLFNKLGREVVYDLDECYLSQQIKGVNNYCKSYYGSKWRVWFTNLKHEYFSSPWTFFSLLAAIFLLLLTTAQTYYTVYGYYISS